MLLGNPVCVIRVNHFCVFLCQKKKGMYTIAKRILMKHPVICLLVGQPVFLRPFCFFVVVRLSLDKEQTLLMLLNLSSSSFGLYDLFRRIDCSSYLPLPFHVVLYLRFLIEKKKKW